MSKKKFRPKPAEKGPAQTLSDPKIASSISSFPVTKNIWLIKGFRLQAIIITVLTIILYANSFNNEYALDDGIVIVRNEYVQEGFSGIPDILTTDAYDSYYRQLNSTNELKGGRYRPLSIVTFAIEQQFMGPLEKDSAQKLLRDNMISGISSSQKEKIIREMHIRHLLNVGWYVLSLLALLYFLRYVIFKKDPLMAFIATLIFAIHPIHTEVVANVKSRDEIMSVLFICLTFIFTFKYRELGKKWLLGAAVASYFLALLSKEYAITLIILLPLSLYLFNRDTVKKILLTCLPFLAVLAVYMLLRMHTSSDASATSGNEVLNDPYLYASPDEAMATKISTAFNYIELLVFPHPLSADYSYNSIPYKNFTDPMVWSSLIFYGGLVFIMFRCFAKRKDHDPHNFRSVICFALAFYFLNFLLICNWIFNLGGTMGERLIYHSSIGFAIAVGCLLVMGAEKIRSEKMRNAAIVIFLALIIMLSGYKTITRNAEWKNNRTLFTADLKIVPNSVIVLGNVVTSLLDDADQIRDSSQRKNDLEKAITLSKKATSIDPEYVAGFFNRGLAYYKLGNMDEAKNCMDSVKSRYPNYPLLPSMNKRIGVFYLEQGSNNYGKSGRWNEAINQFKKGIAVDESSPELWFNLGVAFYAIHDVTGAEDAWKNALRLKPDYQQAQQDLNFMMSAGASKQTK